MCLICETENSSRKRVSVDFCFWPLDRVNTVRVTVDTGCMCVCVCYVSLTVIVCVHVPLTCYSKENK